MTLVETAMGVLNGKVAIVTGASKGIGASIATAMGAAGASVVVNYSSSKDGADRVVDSITSKGGKAIAVQGDVSKGADVLRLLAETKKAFGQLDILVNNAGVFQFDPLESVTEDEFHREFNTNVLGPILLIQESLKHFSDVGGNVINVSSVVNDNPPPNSVVYAATKGALDTITKVLSKEFGARNIRVNTIAPGGTDTEGARRIGAIGSDFETRTIAKTSLGRIGQPEDIARVAVFLASDESAWITGEKLAVSGGWG
jgi:3-oxoacyl-[acyl-carrier protein] reductase